MYVVCIHKAASARVNRLVVCVYVEEKWCEDTPLRKAVPLSSPSTYFPSEFHEEATVLQYSANRAHQAVFPGHVVDLLKQSPMVVCVISSREVYEDYVGNFPCFKAIFDVWVRFNTWAVQYLPGRKPACSGIRTCSITGDKRFSIRRSYRCRGDTKGKLV